MTAPSPTPTINTAPRHPQRVAVIGGGITGVTTAYCLLDKGVEVSLFESHRYAAMETSFANGGQLSASNAEVWTHWSQVLKGLKWMLKADAPLAVGWAPSWHKLSWFAEFLANIPRYRAHTVETARLGILAREPLKEMAAREGIEYDREERGILHVYRQQRSLDHARRVNRLLAEGGLERQELSPEDIRRIEPTVKGTYAGGFFTPSDATGDIHKFTRGLADACARRGATMAYETPVAVRPEGGRYRVIHAHTGADLGLFDAVVVSAGCGSRFLARQLGDRLNIYPVKGYSITVDLRDNLSRAAAPWVSLLDDETKIVASRLGVDRLRVAGTAEFAGYNKDIRTTRTQPLSAWVRSVFPDVATDRVVPWAGLRPMTPSMMPKVGPGRRPGVFYNTGHGHLGWTLSAATARMVAEQVAPGA